MEGWTKFETQQPPAGEVVEIMYSGRIIPSLWDGAVWDIDPRGQVMPMWWRPISAE